MKGDTKFEQFYSVNVREHPLSGFISNLIFKGNVLEAGCGNGELLKGLQNNGINAEGFDISKEAIKLCKENGVKNVQVSSIADFQTNKKYDYILCFSTLYFLRNFEQDFNKLVRLLKENGKLIVNFYNPIRKKGEFISVNFSQFKREIKQNNLKIEKVIPQSIYTGGIKSKYLCQANIYILTRR